MFSSLWWRVGRVVRTAPARLFLLAGVVTAGAMALSGAAAPAGPTQPLAFNHQVMVQAGVQCLFCHNDALRSPSPGMPSVELCMGCHKTIAADRPAIKQIADYYARGEPIPWARRYPVNAMGMRLRRMTQVPVVHVGSVRSGRELGPS